MNRLFRRMGILAVAIVLGCFCGSALADGGLGSPSPNVPNISQSSQYQVFRWVFAGVEYIQVNDLNGNVLFAVATGSGGVLVLPIGTPTNVQVSSIGTSGATAIYSDSAVTITQLSSGLFNVTAAPSAPAVQSDLAPASTCNNPADCSQVTGG